jgi:hypothetical protein
LVKTTFKTAKKKPEISMTVFLRPNQIKFIRFEEVLQLLMIGLKKKKMLRETRKEKFSRLIRYKVIPRQHCFFVVKIGFCFKNNFFCDKAHLC